MARDPPSMAHDVAYRDLGGPSARCVITVHTDASAASECEVFVERGSARTSSDRSPGTLSKDPASTATTAPPRVESWRVVSGGPPLEDDGLVTCIMEQVPALTYEALGEQNTARVHYPLLFSPG